MKKSLITIVTLIAIIAMSTGAAYAWFSSQGKVRGIGVQVGNSGLLVNGMAEWSADVSFDNITPGWVSQPIVATLKNVSEGNVSFEINPRVLFTGTEFQALADNMVMSIVNEDGLNAPEFYTLTWWNENSPALQGGSLVSGEERNYYIMFQLPVDVDDSVQGTYVDLSVLFTGTQI